MKSFLSIALSIGILFSLGAQIISDQSNEIDIDLNNEGMDTSVPFIEWIHPKIEYTNTQEKRVKLEAKVTSSVPLEKVVLTISKGEKGQKIGSRAADMDDKFNVRIDLNMNLIDGVNWIQIEAVTSEGATVRSSRSISVGLDAVSNAVMIDRKDYALLFATNKYDNWNDLYNPIFDADAIAKELEARYGFIVEVVKDNTQNDVMTKLREYAQRKYKPQDQLFIFFAGHGVYDEVFGEGFLVASNSLKRDVSKNSYISHNRIRSNINNIPCDHIFLAMDACFGGTFDPVLASTRALYDEIDDREYLVKKLSLKTRKYLTSGGKEYVSDGIRGQHSPFAKYLIEALKSNGGEDRILVLNEINLYMERLQTTPRFGEFGIDENGSDFVFVAK